jgi:hypothetical protein
MTGSEYADRIARYIVANFEDRGLHVYREANLGKTIIGKNRRIDILVIEQSSRRALAIECKYQESVGTVDEKIPYALQDLAAIGMPVCLVYAGNGFSEGVLHMLAAAPVAANCLPGENLARSNETRELDVALAMTFRWWDLIVRDKERVKLLSGASDS